MNTTKYALEEWEKLYNLMDDISELKPWEWMDESDLFGVKNPHRDEIGFISVMGQLGEHYAIGVYMGEKGLDGFWFMQENGPELSPEVLLQVPQLQASFEDRDYLSSPDREIIRKLGRIYRGQSAWPLFRSYRPGFMPWHLEDDERKFMLHLLEQTLDVAPRYRDNPDLLDSLDFDEYLVRIPSSKSGKTGWHDHRMEIVPNWPSPDSAELKPETIKRWNILPPGSGSIEVDVFIYPSAIQDKNQRPYFPHVLLMVEATNGLVVSNDLLTPLPSQEAMWESVAQKVVDGLIKLKIRPHRLQVSSELLEHLLVPVLKDINVKVEYRKNLPGIKEARESLLNFAGGK